MLDLTSLREQVYQYLRDEMHNGNLLPGSYINMKEISRQLGISKTPLRDAIIQLECERFVSILPRRGVLVNKLTLQDIINSIEIIGALETAAIISAFDKLDSSHVEEMERLNAEMILTIKQEDFERYYEFNIAFHDVFLNLSENMALRQIIMPIKQRLYDFPRRAYIKEWELINCDEHNQFIEFIKRGERDNAVNLWKDSHWSFTVHEKFIRQFYFNASE
ncbi:MAG: GntR family transcriptional regulator, partial [Desulfobacterales bacterium]|nr:GntR family transcriptional regulator [Desulfobacterales bacterium]